MKLEEAQELISWMRAGTKTPPLDAERQAFWESQFVELDAQMVTDAVKLGQRRWEFFPSWKEFGEVFHELTRLDEVDAATERRRELAKRPVGVLPFWLKRYACARFLYARFGKDQDMRPFHEQRDVADPGAEYMPADAWISEAEQVPDEDVWRTIREGAFA